MLLGLVLLWGYVVAAFHLTKWVWAATSAHREWLRLLLSTLVLAVFFAPGFVGAGHGAGLMPAWAALIAPGSNRFAVKGALISFALTWTILFLIGVFARSIRKHPQEQK